MNDITVEIKSSETEAQRRGRMVKYVDGELTCII